MGNFLKLLKRKIISSSFFWSRRHLFQSSWLDSYNSKKVPRLYFDILSNNNISSVLDFGCATGTLLYDSCKKNPNLVAYGIDINKEAISVCKSKFKELKYTKSKFFFDHEFNQENFRIFLRKNNLNKFDLVIFDRVLYCLNDRDLEIILNSISGYSNMILIDDFVYSDEFKSRGYKHRDWDLLLEGFHFENVMNIPTMYSEVDSANARTLLFKKLI